MSGVEMLKSSATRGVVMTSMFDNPLNSAMRNLRRIADTLLEGCWHVAGTLLALHILGLVVTDPQSSKFDRKMFAKFLCPQWHHGSKWQQGRV